MKKRILIVESEEAEARYFKKQFENLSLRIIESIEAVAKNALKIKKVTAYTTIIIGPSITDGIQENDIIENCIEILSRVTSEGDGKELIILTTEQQKEQVRNICKESFSNYKICVFGSEQKLIKYLEHPPAL